MTWFDRYAFPFEVERLPDSASEKRKRAMQIGQDGFQLLQALYHADSPSWLRQIPMVVCFQQVWIQQYYSPEQGGVWRDAKDLPPCSMRIESPYDSEARYASKGRTQWVGYKVHLTESCDEKLPYFITDVQTTCATVNDSEVTDIIQQHLAQRMILPAQHLIDSGYTTADVLVHSHQRGVDVVGKVVSDPSWQRREQTRYDSSAFTIDWDNQQAHCPQGKVNQYWRGEETAYGTPTVRITFAKADCSACPTCLLCTRSKKPQRTLTVGAQAQYQAMQTARQRQTTPAFKDEYAKRAGIEGTMSQSTGAFGLRRSRYRGLAKTHLQNVATSAAINLVRFSNWAMGKSCAKTRISHFAQLKPLPT